MNNATPYEELIARKLQELTVPDQADAIWATIEQQLNVEMPPDSSAGTGGSSSFNWWMGGGSLFTISVALISYMVISKNDPERQIQIHRDPKHVEIKKHMEKPGQILAVPPKENVRRNTIHSDIPQARKPDLIPEVASGTLTPEARDSASTPARSVPILPNAPVRIDSLNQKQKPMGVKGITDADYRLMPSGKAKPKP